LLPHVGYKKPSNARLVWSNKPARDFEDDARKLFKAMNDARKPSLTPPDLRFGLAQLAKPA